MSFLKHFLGVKADQGVEKAIQTIASIDPKGMTEAQIRMMDEDLTRVSRSVAETRVTFQKEEKEAIAAKKAQDERFQVSEILIKQLDAETDPSKKASISKDLDTVLGDIEKFAPEVDREVQEAKDAKELLEMLEGAQTQAANKLKTARAELNAAQRDMQKAKLDRENAARLEAAAKEAAGISNATGSIDTAMKAMRANAERDRVAAAASRDKARLLATNEASSDRIKSALAEARGTVDNSTLSPADRLAALKARSAA